MELGASDRASYLEPLKPWGPGRRIYNKKPANIFPMLEESEDENFPKVYLRIKPHKRGNGEKFVVNDDTTLIADVPFESIGNNSIRPLGRPVKHQYKFSKIFGPSSTQKELFRETCFVPLKLFLRGENCLLFAYGATSAGKTYTIQGNEENPGVIPQSINMIFSTLKGRLCYNYEYKPYRLENVIKLNEDMQEEEMKVKANLLGHSLPIENVYPLASPVLSNLKTPIDFKSPSFQAMKSNLDEVVLNLDNEKNVSFSLWVSFYEIHNEVIYDLLNVSHSCDVKRKPLSIGYINGSAYIKDITQVHVSSADEAYQIYIAGKNNLKKAATNLNSESSRSHCIFSVTMIRLLKVETPQPFKVNILSFIDLAGAERVKKTLSVGDRLRESQNINTSLHVLGRCLSVMRDNQKSQRKLRVPFRDSKLTQIFQYALTGNQGIAMMVNITLDTSMYNETVNVLKFSALAREIVPEPQYNSSHFLSSTNIFGNKHSLLKFNDTQISSLIPQSNDCDHLPLINELKRELEEEREKCLELKLELERAQKNIREIDANVRSDLTTEFSSILQKKEDFWKNHMKSALEDAEDMAKFNEEKLKEFYDRELKKEQKTVKCLRRAVLSMQESRRDAKIENNALKVKLDSMDRKLQILEQLENEKQDDNMVTTLRKQLEEAMKVIELKDTEIHELKLQIEEAEEGSGILESDRNCILEDQEELDPSLIIERGLSISDLVRHFEEEENESDIHGSIEACDVVSVDSDIEIIE